MEIVKINSLAWDSFVYYSIIIISSSLSSSKVKEPPDKDFYMILLPALLSVKRVVWLKVQLKFSFPKGTYPLDSLSFSDEG